MTEAFYQGELYCETPVFTALSQSDILCAMREL